MMFSAHSRARLRALPGFDSPDCVGFRVALSALSDETVTQPFLPDEQAWVLSILRAQDGSCSQTHLAMDALRQIAQEG